MKKQLILSLLFGCLLSSAAFAAGEEKLAPQAPTIIADVSDRLIAVTTGYTGTSTTLFGALPENGDVILTVEGPRGNVVVRRKEKFLGLWLNRAEARFGSIPGFYWVASSRPLEQVTTPEWLVAHRIGADHQRFAIIDATDYRQTDAFFNAMVDLKVKGGLYPPGVATVSIMGGRLYRADVSLPDDAPTGEYTVTTYLMQHGEAVEVQTTQLTLQKEGAMARLSVASRQYAVLYGMFALLLALLSGWASAVLMRRS